MGIWNVRSSILNEEEVMKLIYNKSEKYQEMLKERRKKGHKRIST